MAFRLLGRERSGFLSNAKGGGGFFLAKKEREEKQEKKRGPAYRQKKGKNVESANGVNRKKGLTAIGENIYILFTDARKEEPKTGPPLREKPTEGWRRGRLYSLTLIKERERE